MTLIIVARVIAITALASAVWFVWTWRGEDIGANVHRRPKREVRYDEAE